MSEAKPLANGRLQLLAACAVYFAYTAYLTWPALLHINHSVMMTAGDAQGDLATIRAMVSEGLNPFLRGTIHAFAQPEGLPVSWASNLASAPNFGFQYLLVAAFGQIAAWTIYQFVGYLFTGAVTFCFIRQLTGKAWLGLIFGWAYAFYPATYLNAVGHHDFLYGGWLVLALWRLLELQREPTRRNALLAAAAVCAGMWWTPYYILIIGVLYATAAALSLLVAWRERQLSQTVRSQAVGAGVVSVFLGLLAALSLATSGGGAVIHTNNLGQLLAFGARPLEYLLPGSGHLLFGSLTASYFLSHQHGSDPTETTLYVGWSLLVLASVCVVLWMRQRLRGQTPGTLVFMLVLVGFVALVCSAPGEVWLLGVKIPMPSYFIAKISSTWRVYSRFSFLVMLVVVTLAALGSAQLLARLKPRATTVLLLAIAAVVLVDLSYRTSPVPNYQSTNPALSVLRQQPRGLVAEYPLVPDAMNLFQDTFAQPEYDMPMINGYSAGTVEERRALTLYYLNVPATATRLAALGVRYVLLARDRPPYLQPSPGTPGDGFALLYRAPAEGSNAELNPPLDLYRVTAPPSGPGLVTLDAGFETVSEPLGNSPANWFWMTASTGSLEVAGVCPSCAGVLRMTLAPLGESRRVWIISGKTVIYSELLKQPGAVTLHVRFPPSHTLEISSAAASATGQQAGAIEVRDLSFSWPEHRGPAR
jgi:hypothetical protein